MCIRDSYYMAEVTKVKDGENTVRVLSNATKTLSIIHI